jgi:hypothetical protein
MSIQVSALPASIQNATDKINCSLTDYHPSIWGDHFLHFLFLYFKLMLKTQVIYQRENPKNESKMENHRKIALWGCPIRASTGVNQASP